MEHDIRRAVVAAAYVAIGLFMTSTAKTLPHHGFTAYDLNHQITLDGTVTAFRFANPHVQLHMDVKDEQGNVVNWRLEGSGVYYWSRAGWSANSLQPGDRLTVTVAPAKAGTTPIGLISKIVLPNGRALSMGR